MNSEGFEALWGWFSTGRASWLTLPRSMMHEMPDEWQARMADLLREWDATWDSGDMPEPHVIAKKNGRFTRWPSWLINYRHPNRNNIAEMRVKKPETASNANAPTE